VNILHLYDGHEKVYEGRGSVPNVVWNLARETASRGHEVTVLERQWEGLDSRAVHEGVSFRRLSLRTGAQTPWEDVPYEMVSSIGGAARLLLDRTNFAVQALRTLRTMDFDVVHVHLPFAANVIATVAPSIRERMVYTAHIGETEERVLKPRFSPDAYLARRVARTIILNPEMRTAFESREVSADRLTVIPNGVDIERFQGVTADQRQAIREQYGLGDGPVVLFVGTVTPRKGVRELMQAAVDVLSTRSEPRLVIVGKTDMEPGYMRDVRDVVDRSDSTDRIVFTGFVPDEEVPVFYDLADVFVLPSYEEGSSIAVTEAIATGTPVVGSRIDGIRQQIEHGVHGLLVDAGDTNGLGDAIATLLDDDERRASMARALEERAEELSWPRVTERIVDVYEEVRR
jgi:glycosyltransferase involved in cell wall biosynthesis